MSDPRIPLVALLACALSGGCPPAPPDGGGGGGCAGDEADARSVRFGGGGARVPSHDALDIGDDEGTERTVEVWFRMDAEQDGDEVILLDKRGAGGGFDSEGTDYSFRLLRGADESWSLAGSTGPDTDACAWDARVDDVAVDAWHHVALTVSVGPDFTGTKTLWLDGDEGAACAFEAKPRAANHPLMVASPGSTVGAALRGWVDAVRISDGLRYTEPFEPAAALALDATTTAVWGFDDGAGEVATDATGTRDAALFGEWEWSSGGACGR